MNRGMMNKRFLVLFFTLLSSMCGVEAKGNWRESYGPGSRRFVSSVLSAIALGVGARFVPKLKSKASLLSSEIEALELLLKENPEEADIAKLLKNKRKNLNVTRALLGLAAGSLLVGGVKLGHNVWRNEQYRAGLNAFDLWDDPTANPIAPNNASVYKAHVGAPLDAQRRFPASRYEIREGVRPSSTWQDGDNDPLLKAAVDRIAAEEDGVYKKWLENSASEEILLTEQQQRELRADPRADNLEFRRALSDRNRPNQRANKALNDACDEWDGLDAQTQFLTYGGDRDNFDAQRMAGLGHGKWYNERYIPIRALEGAESAWEDGLMPQQKIAYGNDKRAYLAAKMDELGHGKWYREVYLPRHP